VRQKVKTGKKQKIGPAVTKKSKKIGPAAPKKSKNRACGAENITQCATEKIVPLAQGSLIISQLNLHVFLGHSLLNISSIDY
jgi:hypothetical protein